MKLKLNKPTDTIVRQVELQGLADIMFDRYAGDNDTKLTAGQKLYIDPNDSVTIGLPALNIMSLLTAHNTNSAPKRLRDKRKYKQIANACLSYVSIAPMFIPFLRNGKPVKFGDFNSEDKDKLSGCYVHRAVARLKDGIPNPKVRPVLPLPWTLKFKFTLLPTTEIKEQEIANLLQEAGLAIGLGTFRGVFGKFAVASWD